MVLGLYYLSLAIRTRRRRTSSIPTFGSVAEALLALDRGHAGCTSRSASASRARRCPTTCCPKGWADSDAAAAGRTPVVRTTIGRVILNGAFPDDFEFRNHSVLKADVARLVDETVHRYDRATVEESARQPEEPRVPLRDPRRRHDRRRGRDRARGRSRRSSTITRSGRRRSRGSTARASSPTTSVVRS